ncbi:hypothetical protein AARAC_006320 [Aspergillus arachidicola]|uniref:Amino acid permease/ SLC12A domain-containing protein n=1 Tax=Aspergillus arachidicola TaxID=656916 RepID=A0A2G7FTZ2_9EURO|nr:hypothetical protein AARAC_006320 [Aspergillus arachidicola]
MSSLVADNPYISAVTEDKYETKDPHQDGHNHTRDDLHEGAISPANSVGGLHRRLGNRQIQLVAIGGSIGTGLFIAIGTGLYKGGPGSLLLAFIIESLIVGMLNNCLAEMTTYMPVSGGFIRLAGYWVDEAWGFMAGWNFFIYMALTVPFAISTVNVLLEYWRHDIPVIAVCLACIAAYAVINLLAVGTYGEAEFWLSSGKVILIFILFLFTFITMVGGNPKGDAYGFRHWQHPGTFAEYASVGDLGRFEGFLGALWIAVFTVVGPEYISTVAAEAKHPYIYIKNAFKTVYWRSGVFFIGGAFALMVTTVFSAGKTYTYAATRALHGMAVEGRAPQIFSKTDRRDVPIYSFTMVMAFAFLSLLQLSGSAMQVLEWLISLTTANILIDYMIITTTYVCFYNACKAQNFDRSKLPYPGLFQPYCGSIALAWMVLMALCFGYRSFTPWSTANFFLSYTMLLLAPVTFIGQKIYKGTRWPRPHEVDLKWKADLIAAYEAVKTEQPTGFWREMIRILDVRRLCNRKRTSIPV